MRFSRPVDVLLSPRVRDKEEKVSNVKISVSLSVGFLRLQLGVRCNNDIQNCRVHQMISMSRADGKNTEKQKK